MDEGKERVVDMRKDLRPSNPINTECNQAFLSIGFASFCSWSASENFFTFC